MRVGLTKYGRREIATATAAAGALIGVLAWALGPSWAFWAPAGVAAALWAWVLAFFRDPERRVPDGEGLFVSPADGRVSDVTPLGPDSDLGREGVRVGIFMSVFDVHVNRSPCAGRVEEVVRRRGAFLDARDPLAAGRNESATIRIACECGGRRHAVVVRQVAGRIARRIVTDLAEGQTLDRGQRIGMIKFGSRVELAVPRELAGSVRVRVGQRVRAGRTVLFAAGSAP